MKQLQKVLYMETRDMLLLEIDWLIADGYRIDVVTHLRELREPEMNGVVVTDWLILYSKSEAA